MKMITMSEAIKQAYEPLHGVNGPMPQERAWRAIAAAIGVSRKRIRRAAAWRRRHGGRSFLEMAVPSRTWLFRPPSRAKWP